MNGVGENAGITIETPFRLKSHEKYPIKWKKKNISHKINPVCLFYFISQEHELKQKLHNSTTWSIINEV